MIRFYSLFVTDEKIFTSPFVRRFNPFHDLTIHRGKTETLHFLLQTSLTDEQFQHMNILFDPHNLEIKKIKVKAYSQQTILTVHLVPKEIGSHKIGIAFPQSPKLHEAHLKRISSPFLAVPCTQFVEPNFSLEPVPEEARDDQFVAV
jgi:hypothetical protein